MTTNTATSRQWKLDFSMMDEKVPCIQIAGSGIMEVISVISDRKPNSKLGIILVSVGRNPMDGIEKFFEENYLSALFFDSKIILSANLNDDGRELMFEFDRSLTDDETAAREVLRILGIEEYWSSGRRTGPD